MFPDHPADDGCETGVGDGVLETITSGGSVDTPNAWVGDRQLLTSDGYGISLFTFSDNPEMATQRSAVPQVGRENKDPVPDPTGKSFAFLSQVPSTNTSPTGPEQLWIRALAGGSPRKIADVPNDVRIIGWL